MITVLLGLCCVSCLNQHYLLKHTHSFHHFHSADTWKLWLTKWHSTSNSCYTSDKLIKTHSFSSPSLKNCHMWVTKNLSVKFKADQIQQNKYKLYCTPINLIKHFFTSPLLKSTESTVRWRLHKGAFPNIDTQKITVFHSVSSHSMAVNSIENILSSSNNCTRAPWYS